MVKNLQRKLDEIIAENKHSSLLLHSCCAPCSSYVLEYLNSFFDITLFFYNPNIIPETEFQNRVNELKRLIKQMPGTKNIKFLEIDYNPKEFLEIAKGLENEPEGGGRCEKCFTLRLEAAAKQAKKEKFDYFTTTLSISPHKNSQQLNEIAEIMSKTYGVKNLPSDFKKKGGYQRSLELSKDYDLYRQNWCGCPFSKAQREREENE